MDPTTPGLSLLELSLAGQATPSYTDPLFGQSPAETGASGYSASGYHQSPIEAGLAAQVPEQFEAQRPQGQACFTTFASGLAEARHADDAFNESIGEEFASDVDPAAAAASPFEASRGGLSLDAEASRADF